MPVEFFDCVVIRPLKLHVRNSAVEKKNSDYWCSQWIQIWVQGPDISFEVVTEKPFARIGRHQESEVVLNGKNVAKRHLYLHATPNGIYCVNLAKSHAKEKHVGEWINSESPIKVGPYKITVKLIHPRDPIHESTNIVVDTSSSLHARGKLEVHQQIVFKAKSQLVGRHALTRRLSTLGRDPACTFALTSRSLSMFHCILYQQHRKTWVIDLNPINRTKVDGLAIEVAAVSLGSTFRVGRVQVSFEKFAGMADRHLDASTIAGKNKPVPRFPTDTSTSGKPKAARFRPAEDPDFDAKRISAEMLPPTKPISDSQEDESDSKESQYDSSIAEIQVDHHGSANFSSEDLSDAASQVDEKFVDPTTQDNPTISLEVVNQRQTDLDALADKLQKNATELERDKREWHASQKAFTIEFEKRAADLENRENELIGKESELRALENALLETASKQSDEQKEAEERLVENQKAIARAGEELEAKRLKLTDELAGERQIEQKTKELENQANIVAETLAAIETENQALETRKNEIAKTARTVDDQADRDRIQYEQDLQRLQEEIKRLELELKTQKTLAEEKSREIESERHRFEAQSEQFQVDKAVENESALTQDSVRIKLETDRRQLELEIERKKIDFARHRTELNEQEKLLEDLRSQLELERMQWGTELEQEKSKLQTLKVEYETAKSDSLEQGSDDLLQQENELAEQRAILAAEFEKLETTLHDLGKVQAVEELQTTVLGNLKKLQKKKSWLYRLMRWLNPFSHGE